MIGREPPVQRGDQRCLGENAGDRVVADPPAEADRANRRQLAQPKAGVLGFQGADGLADVLGEALRRVVVVQEGGDARGLKPVGVPGNGA